MGNEGPEVEVGSVWRQELLGSVALYDVVEDLGDIVIVAVREAPGLAPGTQVRMTREALRAMVLVSGAADRARRC
jgi:hypothetical protein